jgi:tetratricopeptide (TPR) repeat protein
VQPVDPAHGRTRLALAALLVLTAAAVWGPHLSGTFFWDDAAYLRDNPLLAPGSPLLGSLSVPITGQAFRPLSTATLWLQVQLHGFSMVPLRAAQVAMHVACAGLVGVWLSRSFPASVAPGLAAALFLVHPAATEAVMFVSARHDLLGALFGLGALALMPAPDGRSRWRPPILAFGATALAVSCKETYVVVAPLLALQAYLEDGERPRRALSLGAAAAAGAVAVFAARAALGVSTDSGMKAPAEWLARAYAALVLHHGAAFVTFTDGPSVLRFVPATGAVAALVFVALAVAVFVAARESFTPGRRDLSLRDALLSLAVFTLGLAPAVAALPATMQHANRYGYFALAGFCGLVASGVAAIERRERPRRWNVALLSVAGAGLVALAARSSARAAEWRDGLALFGADVVALPDDSRAAYHYGVELVARRGCDAALPLFERAVREEPTYARAQRNVAACLLRLHRPAEALEPATAAVRLEPNVPAHRRNLAAALGGVGRMDEARSALDEAARLTAERRGR